MYGAKAPDRIPGSGQKAGDAEGNHPGTRKREGKRSESPGGREHGHSSDKKHHPSPPEGPRPSRSAL